MDVEDRTMAEAEGAGQGVYASEEARAQRAEARAWVGKECSPCARAACSSCMCNVRVEFAGLTEERKKEDFVSVCCVRF